MLSQAQTTCRYCGNTIRLVMTRKYVDKVAEFMRMASSVTVLLDKHKYEDCEVYSAEMNVSLFPREANAND